MLRIVLAVVVLFVTQSGTAFALTNDTQIIDVEWENPTEIAAVEQQEEQFIVSTKTGTGRVNNLYFTFPADGGVRFRGDEEGIFKPETLTQIQYSVDGAAIVMEANGTKVKLYTKAQPWRFDVYNSEDKLVVSYQADHIWFGYDQNNALRKVKAAAELAQDETLFGLGERFSGFVQNGKTVEMWNTDCFAQLSKSYGDQNVGYKNIPLLHSNSGYSVFHNNTYYGIVDLGESNPAEYSFEFYGPILDMYIWTDSTVENIGHYNDLTGSTVMVPKWALSYWAGQSASVWLKDGDDTETVSDTVFSRLDRYEELGTPIQNIYAEGIAAKLKYVDIVKDMQERGIHVFGWMDSTWRSFDDDITAEQIGDFETMDKTLYPLVMWEDSPGAWWWSSDGAKWVDYSDPVSVEWLESRFEPFLGNGLYGMMVDYNDKVGVETYYPGNQGTGDWMHNFSAYYYDQAVSEIFKNYYGEGEYITFARAACAGSQQFTAVFGGDQTSTFLGLQQSVSALLSSAASGINIWGSDIGGLGTSDDAAKHSPTLYARWLQFGTFSPLMRAHGQTGWRDPWEYDNNGSSTALFQKYYWTRENLVDLLYSGTVKAGKENIPMTQSMVVAYPEDKSLAANGSQYLFCDSLLVCPVTEEKDAFKTVQFPAGRWVDLFDGTVYEGGQTVEVSAPLDKIPVFIEAGSAFPVTLGEDLDIGTINTEDKNVSALMVAPATEKKENVIYLAADETQTILCDKLEEDVYSVAQEGGSDKRIVVAMGCTADNVSVDNKTLPELTEKPTSASTEAGYYRDMDNNSTIIVTGGKWNSITYTDSGDRLANLALNRPVTAEGLGEKAAENRQAMVDGSYSNALALMEGEKGQVTLDLEKSEEISKVLVKWGTTYARSYTLEASEDGENWTVIYEKEKGGGGTDTVMLAAPGSYRYLRISDIDSSSKMAAELIELEVYGTKLAGDLNSAEAADDLNSADIQPESPDENSIPMLWWGIGGAVLLAVMIAAVVMILRKHKRKSAAADASDDSKTP